MLVGLGVLLSPWLVGVLVPGFDPARRDLATTLVRIMFPGVGLLVLSAWCLGILNSHRRFFLAYAAPVVWNLAIIGATLAGAALGREADLVVWAAWGAVLGSGLQFAIQLPAVRRLAGGVRPSLGTKDPAVRRIIANFLPAAGSRGVVQIGAFADAFIASWLPRGAVTAITNSQLLYTLPVSLFGMSIAAAELPALAEAAEREGEEGRAAALHARLEAASRHLAFFIVPSAVAFLVLGQSIAALVLQSGEFTAADSRWVWGTLAGSAIGLLAATLARLYSSAFFALGDTRTPFRYAVVRIGLGVALGASAALLLPGLVGVDPKWGTVGLSAAAGVVGWVEFVLLRRALERRVGRLSADWSGLARLWGAAVVAAGAAWLLRDAIATGRTGDVVAILVYGAGYLGLCAAMGVPTIMMIRTRFGGGR